MKLLIKLFFFTFVFVGFSANAEGRCPPGYLPSSQFEFTGCQPINEPNQGPDQNQPSTNKGYWVDSYASLVWAYTKDGMPAYSYSYKHANQKTADEEALSQCSLSKFEDCKVVLQFANGYLAIATDDIGKLYGASEFEDSTARLKAIQDCANHDSKNCRIVESINSRAVWVE